MVLGYLDHFDLAHLNYFDHDHLNILPNYTVRINIISVETAGKLSDSCNDLQTHIAAARAEVDARRQVKTTVVL